MAKLVKYMGSADEATIPKGHDFGGSVKEGTTKEVRFDKSNSWVVDVEEAGLSEAQIEALLEDGDRFKDVSDSDRIPHNKHQTTFHAHRGMAKSEPAEKVSEASSTVSDGGTTTGGSTDGDTGAGTSRRRGAAT